VLTKTESSSETGTSSSDYDGIEPVPQGDHRDRGLTKSSIEIDACRDKRAVERCTHS
jgi:hypothetical protein